MTACVWLSHHQHMHVNRMARRGWKLCNSVKDLHSAVQGRGVKRGFATEMLRILKTIGLCREAPEYQDIDARRIQHNLPQSTASLALPHQKIRPLSKYRCTMFLTHFRCICAVT